MGSCLSTTAKTNVFLCPVLFEISPVAHVFFGFSNVFGVPVLIEISLNIVHVFEIFHIAPISIQIVSMLFKISPGPFYEVSMPGAIKYSFRG